MSAHPILQLESHVINQIAAGEVVERPLSVVKELTENAIDAGASVITAEIRDGGLTFIRVTDNGAGIPAEELPLAFARHATSKIAGFDDLFAVSTLGFRGEALCSIAAVAQVEMLTKTRDAVAGTRVEIHGGQVMSRQAVGCADGTTLVVSNLFYNTPARRKFLKKDATEAGYIADCMERLAMGSPGRSFRFINNGEPVLQTNGNGDLKTVLLQVYDREVAAKLIEVEASSAGMQLRGYVGKPEIARSNRQRGSFFINGRYIQSRLLQRAAEDAMKTMLPGGKFPVYALHMAMPPAALDVNVHPTKMDVRFADEDGAYTFVREALYEALTDHVLIPETRLKPHAPPFTPPAEAYEEQPLQAAPLPLPTPAAPVISREMPPFPEVTPSPGGSVFREDAPTPARVFFYDYKLMGLLFGTYWLVAQGDSLYAIDQHAAHERVLYEEIRAAAYDGPVHSQPLLEPIALRLTPREAHLLRENAALFTRFGFEIESEKDTAAVTAVPFMLRGPLSPDFFTELLDKMDNVGFAGEAAAHRESALATMACKAAVKANDALNEAEAEGLIRKMLALENPFTCPHGRPTVIEITKRELERKFKR